jgi:hypothetical protein
MPSNFATQVVSLPLGARIPNKLKGTVLRSALVRISAAPANFPGRNFQKGVYTLAQLLLGPRAKEFLMSARFVLPLVMLITLPAFCQQGMPTPMGRPIQWQHPTPEVSPEQRALAVEKEAHDLSVLSNSIQEDLQSLQKGMLTKDLHEKLKKLEKLAKRLREDVGQ